MVLKQTLLGVQVTCTVTVTVTTEKVPWAVLACSQRYLLYLPKLLPQVAGLRGTQPMKPKSPNNMQCYDHPWQELAFLDLTCVFDGSVTTIEMA